MERILQKNQGDGQKTTQVLDTNLLIEGEKGATTIFSIIEYPPAADFCEAIIPDSKDYETAFQIALKLRKIGRPLRAVDILIASTCINRGLELLTKDSDFENVKKVEPDFKLVLRR